MMQAIQLFEQVVARDREYAPGYAGLSAAYGMLTAFGSTAIPPEESRKKAKAAALRAIELDPNSAEAWVNLAPKFVEELDWASAESAFRKALELSQNSPEAHAWYAELYLTPMGRLEEALRESQAAVALDPLSPYTVSGMGRRHYFLRQYDEAIVWFQKALDLDPHFHMAVGPLLHTHLLKGDLAGARRFLDGQKSIWPAQTLAPFQAQLAAAEGDRTAAAALAKSPGGGCQQPAIYASMGDRVQVISWLDRLIETRASCFTWIPAEPLYASLHGTPEFDALILKMKLPAPHGATTVSH